MPYKVLQGFNVPVLEGGAEPAPETESLGGKRTKKQQKATYKPWALLPGDRITVEDEFGEIPEPPQTEFHLAGEEVDLPEEVAARYVEINFLEDIEPEPAEGREGRKGKKMKAGDERDKPEQEKPPQPPPPKPPQPPPSQPPKR